jgi:hypothetical protein
MAKFKGEVMAKYQVVGATPDGKPIYGKRPGCRHWMHLMIFLVLCAVAGPAAPPYLIVWGLCYLDAKRG